MNAISRVFADLRGAAAPGLVTYVTAGDPDLQVTASLLRALPAAGADIIEVGVPFSDPIADGPAIQRASERALRSSTTLRAVLDTVARERSWVAAPLVLFSYANPIERLGYEEFTDRASDAGIDGVLVLDLPVEEAAPLARRLTARGIAPIFLVSPTTPADRVRRADALGSGFLYAISRLGVTGVQRELSDEAARVVETIRAVSTAPVALGFGISTPAQVRAACAIADAAVVGSALVNVIAEAPPDVRVACACDHVRWLKGGA